MRRSKEKEFCHGLSNDDLDSAPYGLAVDMFNTLNSIDVVLDSVDYSGSYVDGITKLKLEVERLASLARDWMPIATAPKSEMIGCPTLILGFVPHSCGGYMCVFYWNHREGQWQNNIDGGLDKPTHWMPLPEPPAGA